ncbi:hypothetical protein P40081_09690 [Paenibacillus sp. FSL P4-0081]|nr:alanine--tRNA ligase-related protein [Paenibacillus sp. FSL P4-0081]AIQ28417.1 hypothetical protein P40081_09690 [Paenibacillus sp. FSL P4-0081]
MMRRELYKKKASEICSKWLQFFKSKGHRIEPSASLVPHNDPSLLWINAGMAPLKANFEGRVVRDLVLALSGIVLLRLLA